MSLSTVFIKAIYLISTTFKVAMLHFIFYPCGALDIIILYNYLRLPGKPDITSSIYFSDLTLNTYISAINLILLSSLNCPLFPGKVVDLKKKMH